ncbi:hypothetical protein SAMN02745215_01156 [Desulfitobacterium chlororespirans DSM 11544]|uniref:Uncharacterized protein n=1 Tax=Desulfitobacterium chlororespirans DSM 11544 TaxID=1121395 RepID=A0A1M7SPB3_9FIRM|nr:hypothetical protein SAMN02745215_01156 [Desulfitobacterium chlororespirans DSM 11544]
MLCLYRFDNDIHKPHLLTNTNTNKINITIELNISKLSDTSHRAGFDGEFRLKTEKRISEPG